MTPYWTDGQRTIYHGDCRGILPSIGTVDAVITDPPYGMGWDTNLARFSGGRPDSIRRRGMGRDYGEPIAGDDEPFDPSIWIQFPRVVLWGMHHFAERLPVGTVLVWIKRHDAAFGSFLSDAELAWMKGGHGVYCRRDLSLNGETSTRAHPTQKPVPLMGWCIDKAGVVTGETILDPFMGSGTTLVAAKLRGVRAIGIELDEKYCEVAAGRLSQEVLAL